MPPALSMFSRICPELLLINSKYHKRRRKSFWFTGFLHSSQIVDRETTGMSQYSSLSDF